MLISCVSTELVDIVVTEVVVVVVVVAYTWVIISGSLRPRQWNGILDPVLPHLKGPMEEVVYIVVDPPMNAMVPSFHLKFHSILFSHSLTTSMHPNRLFIGSVLI